MAQGSGAAGRLSERIAVITGAARGIGRAIALAFAREGAQLVVVDLLAPELHLLADEVRKRFGNQIVPVRADISHKSEVESLAERVLRELGPTQILVNNAGVVHYAPLEQFPEAEWDRVLAVNLKAPFLLAQAIGRQMIEQQHGSIVNISSIGGHLPNLDTVAYSASKAGIRALTAQIALEWGPRGVRCNAISPGLTTSAMAGLRPDRDVEARRAELVPLRRVGTPEDIAQVAVFLASDESAYVSGQTILVDGAYSQSLLAALPRKPLAVPPA